MNVRKPVDYSAMFTALDALMAADLPQMKLYCEIGRLVSTRPEKGAAVAAAEYLCGAYPDAVGFSPRNLRRMREFYRTYEGTPEILTQARAIGWTQNVVFLEAELSLQERAWYIKAVGQFGWSKLELAGNIHGRIHENMVLDNTSDPCYSNGSGGDKGGEKETPRVFLQGLRNEKVQRELYWQRPCGTRRRGKIRSVPFPPPAKTALRSFAPSLPTRPASLGSRGGPLIPPPERERDDMAEKLKNRTRDHRPEVKSLACTVYVQRFPRQARNQKKQELSIHTLEIFWWGEDYCGPADTGLEEENSLWSVHVEYSNGEVQDMKSADDLPDHGLELLFALAELFE